MLSGSRELEKMGDSTKDRSSWSDYEKFHSMEMIMFMFSCVGFMCGYVNRVCSQADPMDECFGAQMR